MVMNGRHDEPQSPGARGPSVMATRDDVAKLAGVSSATVSYVVNNGPRPVSEQTRRRVLQAIEALDYVPSAAARSLKVKRTSTIGLMIPDILNPIFAALAKVVEDELLAAGHSVILCNSYEDPQRELVYLQMLWGKQVDGLLLISTSRNVAMLHRFEGARKPIVLIDRRVPDLAADCVLPDNENGSYEAVRHLIACGHTRIGLINLSVSLTPGAGRLAGYTRALAEAGLPLDPALMKEGPYPGNEGAATFRAMMQLPRRPTAVFISNNRLAHGALEAIKALGLRMPDDIALAVFDDPSFYAVVTPSITAVSIELELQASEATRLLKERLSGSYTGAPRLVTIPQQLVVRESTVGLHLAAQLKDNDGHAAARRGQGSTAASDDLTANRRRTVRAQRRANRDGHRVSGAAPTRAEER
jgi:LacI family transcriptional regulator